MTTKTKDKTNLKTEIIAGITTFFTMSYIIIVNPSILSTQGTGIPFGGALTATVLICFLMTLFMGIYAKLPYGVAPGMGINAFFTFSIILGHGVAWPVALGMVFWSGVLFILVSVTPVRVLIAKAIPVSLRFAIATGIGVFLTFIGLKNAGFIVSDPVTFVKLGEFSSSVGLAILGTIIMIWRLSHKDPLAFIIGIVVVTILGLILGIVHTPEKIFSTPDFSSVFFKLDVLGAIKFSFVPIIISLFFTDLFDSVSTFIGVSQASGMLDKDDQPKNLKQGLIVDAFATLTAGLFGTSSGTTYIESAAGIEAGGRTGITAIFTALCFLPFLFIAPLASMVPAYATAPCLVLVGAMMFKSVSQLSLKKLEDTIPAFLTIILIPLTFSITQGILWGFVSHVVLFILAGRRREIAPMMYGIGVLSVLLLVLEYAGK